MRIIKACLGKITPLGRLGENETNQIVFDLSEELKAYPSATIGLFNRRPGDSSAYPVANITREGNVILWVVSSADLSKHGRGRCELVAVHGTEIIKDDIYETVVFEALDDSGTAPDPWASWETVFVQLKEDAEQAAQEAETAAEHYPHIVDGHWYIWDVQAGEYVNTGVEAQGSDGISPSVSVTDIPGGHRVTIVDAEGTHTFDVMDGVDGADGQDGYSPTVTVTNITGGHRITITDANGEHVFDVMNGDGGVTDVQVNGTSVVTDGVANVPVGSTSNFGALKVGSGFVVSNGIFHIFRSYIEHIKAGTEQFRPIVPENQHMSAFYGLAKAAGDQTQSASSNAVGTYTEAAKSAISQMLNAPVSVAGTTPSITALAGVRYICGEVSTLDITLPASGCIDVTFTSGSTATVLTITPPTGVTVKWANGFDPTALDANTTYEVNICDGLGVACAWT